MRRLKSVKFIESVLGLEVYVDETQELKFRTRNVKSSLNMTYEEMYESISINDYQRYYYICKEGEKKGKFISFENFVKLLNESNVNNKNIIAKRILLVGGFV